MPSWTIVPEVTATSTTVDPQALLIVPMSTPWSRDHPLGPRTRLIGCIGNTQAELADVGGAFTAYGLSFLAAARRLAAVRRPTAPLAGESALASWYCLTADLVAVPK